jgi:signal transduction histidine kinase
MSQPALEMHDKANASDGELLVKTTHLIYLRIGFALVGVVVAACFGFIAGAEGQPLFAFLAAALAAVYSSIALLIVKRFGANGNVLLLQVNAILLVLDILCLSLLVHATRGVDSDLYFLYLLPTVLASHTFGRRGVFVTAFGASLSYLLVLLLDNASYLPYLFGLGAGGGGLTADYTQRLWLRILTRSGMLVAVSFVWASFCQHMSYVAQAGASRLRRELNANHMLMAETSAQAAREQMMNAIVSAVRSTLDIDRILSTTALQLTAALGASRCAIITPAEQSEQAPYTWEAFARNDRNATLPRLSRQLCEFMLANLSQYIDLGDGTLQKTFVYEDPGKEALLKPVVAELSQLKVASLLVQPITYAGDSKGVILIAECEQVRHFSDYEIELVKAVSAQVSIAIEHARLVDQLSRKNRDLLQKNLHLDAKNLELRTVQSQLIHQEKMASLGRIVAGIAHELNNPVNFVHGNLPYLREYVADLKKIISSLDQLPSDHRQTVEALKNEVKYEFLVADLDNIVADLAEGAERIRQIIKNLRSFSRLDEAELKEASIQEGIESTIKILNQYYGRDKLQPRCQFADIPPVTCYPGKLNQVWMNLLSNAAQAVADVPDPKVSVEAKLEGDWVVVAVVDNGAGIKPGDQSKIFEPFFTTKPVGQGTGLGLSICHSIIERHGGNIWCESPAADGAGTAFKVKIPLKAKPEMGEDFKELAVGAD